ncbi:MAG: ABC transporter permease subunit [Propionibacteriaceae bacterium]|jgi:ABC-type transport system involved in multi-copper enzyme maturation permease subunit|nr:ABC transporter permease subunit [Propionibacteriaceae bacterium]
MKTWSLSWNGLRTVAGLELRQRVRSKRWVAALIVWFVVIGGITGLVLAAAGLFGPQPPQVWCQTNETGGQDCRMPTSEQVQTSDKSSYTSNPVCHIDEAGRIDCRVESACPPGSATCPDPVPTQPSQSCLTAPDGSVTCGNPTPDQNTGLDQIVRTVCTLDADGQGSCRYQALRDWQPSTGPLVFSLVTFLVLGLGLLVTPALTSTSINGDRQAGTLATLQATKLSAAELALGKLTAAWVTMLAFALAALPWLVVGVVISGSSIWQVVVCFGVMLIELAIVCAIGLGWSALISRASGSTLLTYASVVVLSVLSIVLVALLTILSTRPTEVRVWGLPANVQMEWDQQVEQYWQEQNEGAGGAAYPAPPVGQCRWQTESISREHGERIWWLAAANPFVILADAAPKPSVAQDYPDLYAYHSGDILFNIRQVIRQVAAGPALEYDRCPYTDLSVAQAASPVKPHSTSAQGPIWPWGLAFNLALGVLFFWIAVRRLAVPYGRLPKDTRVA